MTKHPPTPILQVKNLQVQFDTIKQQILAVKGISFDMYRGETLALVGESGSGKSVTAMSILQLLPKEITSYPSGQILFDGQDLLQLSLNNLRPIRGNRIAVVFQEPMTSLNPLHTISQQIAEVIKLHNKTISRKKCREKVLELLQTVRLPRAAERMRAYPHQLSGGQRQRVMIAMALANEPDILIADEPTTALDVTVQQQILELLVDIQKQRHMAMLFITHDLTVVQKISDRICVMQHGELLETGSTQQVLNNPQHPYTKHLIDSNAKTRKQAIAQTAPTVFEAEHVKVVFPLRSNILGQTTQSLTAVNDLSIHLKQGETVGIVGESGSGKSTFGMACLQLLNSRFVHMQALRLNSSDILHIDNKTFRTLRKDMQIVFQDPFGSLSPRRTVVQILGEGLQIHYKTLSPTEKQALITQTMSDVGLTADMLYRYPHEFSGGQRQRIAIARAIILRPKFLLLDEPTSALDRSIQGQVVDLLLALQGKYNLTYLFISHDLSVVKSMSDRIIVMQNGNIVEQGTTQHIFTTPKTPYTKALIEASGMYGEVGRI